MGPQGSIGPAGPQGVAGADGAQGPKGDAGVAGAAGAAGAQGPQGPAGPEGPVGPQGLQGAQGAQGPAGSSTSDVMPIIWSGGCLSFGDAPGWNTYCFDGLDFNTANEHLTIGQTSITVLKPGFYRLNFFTISHGPSAGVARIYRNGSFFYTSAADPINEVWKWRDTFADVMWPFDAGDVIEVKVFNPQNIGFHSWSPSGAYSRFQMQYIGPKN